MIKKLCKTYDFLLDRIISVFFVMIMLLGIYFIYDSAYVFYNSSAAKVHGYIENPDDVTEIKKLSEDFVAWLIIDDSGIDYPVVQGSNNAEYLNKNAYGEYSLSGAIFLDSRNNSHFEDDYSVVYGHHMENNFMFGALDSFKNKSFFDSHRKGTLKIGEENSFNIKEIETFAFLVVDASEETIFDPTINNNVVNYAQKNASIFYEPSGEHIVALTTCKSPESTLRTIVLVSF